MRRSSILVGVFSVGVLLTAPPPCLSGQYAQSPAADSAAEPAPVTFTTQEDHRNMLEQLGITTLRPGPSGNPSAANGANYDESKANPYPELPALLKLNNGEPRACSSNSRNASPCTFSGPSVLSGKLG
jgi:hypothetical protein